jgi:hypothetical protein
VDEGDGLLAAFKVASFAVDEDEAVQSAAKENGGVKVPYSVIMSSIILLKGPPSLRYSSLIFFYTIQACMVR